MMIAQKKVLSFGRIGQFIRRLAADERGGFAMTAGLCLLFVILVVGLAIDYSNEVQIKYQLDLAADAGAVAASEAWESTMVACTGQSSAPSCSSAVLENNAEANGIYAGTQAFNAQAGAYQASVTPTISYTYVANGAQLNNGSTATGPTGEFSVTYNTSIPTLFMSLSPIKRSSAVVGGVATSAVTLAPYVNVWLILDTSGSMMVGSTPLDVAKIADYVTNHATTLFAGNTNPDLPCAFACHDNATEIWKNPDGPSDCSASSTEACVPMPADMAAGITAATAANATTRFQVLQLALVNDPCAGSTSAYCATVTAYTTSYNSSFGEGLLPYIRDFYDIPNSLVHLNTFNYNIFGFNENIGRGSQSATCIGSGCTLGTEADSSQAFDMGIANSNKAQAAKDVLALTIGYDTHLNSKVLPALAGNANLVQSGAKTTQKPKRYTPLTSHFYATC